MGAGRIGTALVFASMVAFAVVPRAVAEEPTEAEREAAKTALTDALALRNKGDTKAALLKLQGAHKLYPTPVTALELGRTHMMLGELVEAYETFQSVTAMPKKDSEKEASAKARAEAAKLADELKPRLSSLAITLAHYPDSATAAITLDGREFPAGEERLVNPGKHEVTVRAEGVETSVVAVEPKEGEKLKLTIEPPVVKKVDPPPDPTPPKTVPPPPAETQPLPRTTSSLVYLGFGVASAGVVVGSITGWIALSKASSVKSKCDADNSCPPEVASNLSTSRSMGVVSTVAFVVAGAGAVVGVIGLLTPSSDTANASAKGPRPLDVWIGLGSLGVRGAF